MTLADEGRDVIVAETDALIVSPGDLDPGKNVVVTHRLACSRRVPRRRSPEQLHLAEGQARARGDTSPRGWRPRPRDRRLVVQRHGTRRRTGAAGGKERGCPASSERRQLALCDRQPLGNRLIPEPDSSSAIALEQKKLRLAPAGGPQRLLAAAALGPTRDWPSHPREPADRNRGLTSPSSRSGAPRACMCL